MIGEMIGVHETTVMRWASSGSVDEESVIPLDATATTGKVEGSDGKTYEPAKPAAETLTDREQTAVRLRDEGATLKEIAQAIGVSSPQTASNTLRRAEEKRLVAEADEEDDNLIQTTLVPGQSGAVTIGGGVIDPKVYELIEYTARTAAA